MEDERRVQPELVLKAAKRWQRFIATLTPEEATLDFGAKTRLYAAWLENERITGLNGPTAFCG